MKILITGGAGFIGTNTAMRFLSQGWSVVLLDNCSRKGAEFNLADLRAVGPFELIRADVRRPEAVTAALRAHGDADIVLHLAGQVAVTTSVQDPRSDFEDNALGTFNVLEALRTAGFPGLMIYSSTNKVYGSMGSAGVVEGPSRYSYRGFPEGIGEEQPLDFHSPYGCSKGAADQYVRDYARIYGLKTVVFRQSCIYGPHQYGVEDQGWLAWFTIAAATGRPLTVYGNGKQVRDVLYVDDLAEAYRKAFECRDRCAGAVFNVGGGPRNTLSLLELIERLNAALGIRITVRFEDWRPGDQPVFIADIRRMQERLGWAPRTSVGDGLGRVLAWVQAHRDRFVR